MRILQRFLTIELLVVKILSVLFLLYVLSFCVVPENHKNMNKDKTDSLAYYKERYKIFEIAYYQCSEFSEKYRKDNMKFMEWLKSHRHCYKLYSEELHNKNK